jgi:competence protein ComEC
MDHPFRGQGGLFLLLLAYLAGFFLAMAAGAAGAAVSAFLLAAAVFLVALRVRALAVASAVTALCGALAAGRVPFVDPASVRSYLDAEVVLEGRVSELRATDTGWSGTAERSVVSLPGEKGGRRLDKVLLYVRNPDRAVSLPAVLRASGRLRPAGGAAGPGDLPREWTAMAKGARYVFFADASRSLFLPVAPADGGMEAFFSRARRRTGEWVRRHCGTTDGALYLLSLATGETPAFSHPMVSLLRRTGLAHLLAISGVNVAVFCVIAAFLIRTALWAVRRRHGTPDLNAWSVFLSLPACWCYVLLAGAPVPAVRSAGMITMSAIVWRWLGVRAAGAAWSAMLVLTLVRSPMELFSPSFLLSYGATFFLIANCAAGPPEEREGNRRKGWKGSLSRWGKEAVRASGVAFLGTLPVSAAFFQSVPSGAVLWNVLFGPVLGTAGVAGACLAVAGGAFGIEAAGPAVRLVAAGLTRALSALDAVSGSGAGCFPVPPAGAAAMFAALLLAAAGTVFLLREGKKAWPAPVAASVLFLGWIHVPYLALPAPGLRLTALNVGKGAACHVSFPGGGHVLIDAGSALRGNHGERSILPFLRGRGIRKIDILVLTHAHEDHYGGAAALLSSLPVGEIWLPEGVPKEAFGEAVSTWSGPIRSVGAGSRAAFGGAELRVRAVGTGAPPGGANERGTVLELRFGKISVWMPGDTERGPSAWGKAEFPEEERRVLFLPHHGSIGADPRGWVSFCRPVAVVSQICDCFTGENLIPSHQRFLLKNGAFTLRSDGRALYFGQEGRNLGWKLLWRLA